MEANFILDFQFWPFFDKFQPTLPMRVVEDANMSYSKPVFVRYLFTGKFSQEFHYSSKHIDTKNDFNVLCVS